MKTKPFCLAVLVVSLMGVTLVADDDEVLNQLDQLRAKGQFDKAVDYLRDLKDSPEAPDEFKQTIDLEIGRTLVEASRTDRETMRREARLEEAVVSFRKFVKEHPDHLLVSSARSQIANTFVEHARIKVTRSAGNGIAEEAKQRQLKDARTMFEHAATTLETSRKEMQEKLQAIGPLDPADRKLTAVRDQLRGDYLQARLLLPAILEETADTFPDEAEERNKRLEQAVKQFQEVYAAYRTRLAGLYAKMYEGRCYVKLGEHKKALEVFGDLLEQPDDPAVFRQLKLNVVTLAVEAWLDDSQKKYKDAIRELGNRLETARERELAEDDWLFIRFSLARAHKLSAFDLRKTTPDAPQVAESLAAAREHADFVAKHMGEYQLAARELLAELGERIEPPTAEKVKSFDEARLNGRRAIDDWRKAKLAMMKLNSQIGATDDRVEIEKLEEQLLIQTVAGKNALKQSEQYFQRALKLADDNTSIEETTTVRYIICYVHYEKEEYTAAAELGKTLAREHTKVSTAAQSAKIAFASYMKLYQQSDTDKKREAMVENLLDFGDYISKQWPENALFNDVKKSLDLIKKREAQRKAGALDA